MATELEAARLDLAADTDRFSDRDVRHACSLCMEPYRGRGPKILPCFHTFCLPCLTTLAASAVSAAPETQDTTGVKQVDDLKEPLPETPETGGAVDRAGGAGDSVGVGGGGGGVSAGEKAVFLCPTCRAPVNVPEGGVAALQTNFYVEHEQDAEAARPPPLLCDMCEEGNQQSATHHCRQCQIGLCRSCRRFHDKLMPQHTVTGAGLAPLVMPGKQETRYQRRLCLVHHEALCFHCRQCEVSVCLHCKLTSHEGHDTVDLAGAALQAKKEMVSLIASTQQQLQVIESSLQQTEREDRQLTRHAEHVTQRIRDRCETVVTWARQARDQLMEETAAREASSRSQLASERSATALTRDSLSSLLSRAAQAASTDPEVVMVKNELKAALLSDDGLDQHKKRAAERQERPWGWDHDVADASVLRADDVRVFMGRVAEGALYGGDRPPVSLRELADRVDRWMNEVAETANTTASKLASCKDEVAALQKKETEVEKRVKSITDDVAAQATDVDKRVKSLKDDVTAQATDVEKRVKSLKDDVTALQKKETEVEKRVKSLSDDVTALQKKETEVQKRVKSLTDDMTSSKKTEDELRKKTDSLNTDISAQMKTVWTLRDTLGKKVCFTAESIDTQKTRDGSPIVFDTVKVNNGGCYNSTTGYFTATIPGSYTFTCSIGAVGSSDTIVRAYIIVDSTRYACIRGSYTSVGCGSVSVQLTKGQRVWVKADSNEQHYCSGELCFSGSLVQPELV